MSNGPPLIFSVGKLMGARLGQVNELGKMHGLHDHYLRNGQEFDHVQAAPNVKPWEKRRLTVVCMEW